MQTCTDANLTDANLTDANLTDANLTDANLTDANLTDANLTDANLTDANLTDANLTDANLTDANLTDANLTDANLTDANLTDANLTDANLTDANLTDANLTDANLTDANLTDANLTDANLTDANLTDANLTDANLTDANLTDANLTTLPIEGTPKTTASQYEFYHFKPIVEEENVTFSIENKPEFLDFNETTGELSGVLLEEGIFKDIKIIAKTDTAMGVIPFTLTVGPKKNLSLDYAKATQSPKGDYAYYREPEFVIDGDLSTYNFTEGDPEKNWLELELPKGTTIEKSLLLIRKMMLTTLVEQLSISVKIV